MKELKEKYCNKCIYLNADNCNGCLIDNCELIKFLYQYYNFATESKYESFQEFLNNECKQEN